MVDTGFRAAVVAEIIFLLSMTYIYYLHEGETSNIGGTSNRYDRLATDEPPVDVEEEPIALTHLPDNPLIQRSTNEKQS